MFLKILKTGALALLFGALSTGISSGAAPAPLVTLAEDDAGFTLANGIVTARVSKRSGDLVSLQYQNLEMLGGGSGHPYGYWSHAPGRNSRAQNSVTLNPARNGGDRAEVSVRAVSAGTVVGSGPGGGAIADIEIRYALGRGDQGLYTYSIFTHKKEYPATAVGEARFGVKLNEKVFDFLTVDARRRRLMPTPEDWNRGTELNMKEVRRLNTGLYAGQVEHKYDYSAVQFEIPAFGWCGTKARVGLWFVNPTIEYLSGGATKAELTGHLDVNDGAAPVLLNYWRGSHYGGSHCVIPAGEAWTKVIGPFLIYCNAAPDPAALWQDALARAAQEAAAWPYDWVAGVDYPSKHERGAVRGQLVLTDPAAPATKMSNLRVGLAAPDYTVAGRRGETKVDWQNDAKHYEFWVRGDAQGRFNISKVRPGKYTLHAIADGVLGEFARTEITVEPGGALDLGRLEWRPLRHGRQLWEIGIPNRSAAEFRHGDDYWHWGLHLKYAEEFPKDVNFIIGKSDFRRDWNFCQFPRIQKADSRGNGPTVSTTWSVIFDLPEAPGGTATLRLALAATSARGLDVTINDQPAGSTGPLPDNATIRRDGIAGYWTEKQIAFDAALMKAGSNTLKLTIPNGGVTSGIEYDYLRLELEPNATK